MDKTQVDKIKRTINELPWYHTIDLGDGLVTPGIYDHRSYLHYYGFPTDLTDKRVLDVGAASGFFSFELERRGARVTALDLPRWMDHDFGPLYQFDNSLEEAEHYLHDPLEFAKSILDSSVEKHLLNLYDLSPKKVGTFDLVFCGSVLLHLTDPIKALWQIQSVTKGAAIIATALIDDHHQEPVARFVGHHDGMSWWFPNRACLERMVQAAGFAGWEWVSEFRLDYGDGRPGHNHGVIRAWNNRDEVKWPKVEATVTTPLKESPSPVATPPTIQVPPEQLVQCKEELTRLQRLVESYEQGKFITFMRKLHDLKNKIRS